MEKHGDKELESSFATSLRRAFQRASIAFMVFGALMICLGERLPDNLQYGFGWDGGIYGCWGQDFWEGIRKIFVPSDYHAQRIFPSFLVHHALRALMPAGKISEWMVIKAFQVFNLGLTLVCIVAWYRICVRLQASARRFWFGYMAFAFNFAILKFPFFYPVLTDSFALAFGMLTVYAVLARRLALLWLVGLMGAFTWPTVFSSVFLLLIFWNAEPLRSDAWREGKWKKIPEAVAGISAALTGLISLSVYFRAKTDPSIVILHGYGRFNTVLATLFLMGFVYCCVLSFLRMAPVPDPRTLFKPRWKGLLPPSLALIGWIIVRLVVRNVSNGQKFDMSGLLDTAVSRAFAYPAVFLVAHVIYFGPVTLLVVWKWRDILGVMRDRLGLLGMVLVFSFLPWSISSESRAIINYFPLAVVGLAITVEERLLTRRNLFLFGAVSLVSSKFWFPLNHRMFEKYVPFEVTIPNFQRYFMNFGVFFTNKTYAINLAVAVCLGIAMAAIFRNRQSRA